ncbi:hypothetical protein [Rhizobium herbae]|uniref:DUF4148 domain-containing protein n=1 Tax=Rhizobium herbae TaxID=508661 RepID=A0ABS4EFM4_9HYPH|nr:hypothetical protein [Rhizobium herbae]MBP1856740.1 hypothetical protein [Rhizobium herbae]
MKSQLRVLVTIVVAFVAASMAVSAPVSASQPNKGLETMDRPPDPEQAVLSEYRLLKARGTIEAYELFIERHPDHPLADDARRELKKLRGS